MLPLPKRAMTHSQSHAKCVIEAFVQYISEYIGGTVHSANIFLPALRIYHSKITEDTCLYMFESYL